jgi:hypothetical protein
LTIRDRSAELPVFLMEVRTLEQYLGKSENRGQWGSQLMGETGNELILGLVEPPLVLDPRCHRCFTLAGLLDAPTHDEPEDEHGECRDEKSDGHEHDL